MRKVLSHTHIPQNDEEAARMLMAAVRDIQAVELSFLDEARAKKMKGHVVAFLKKLGAARLALGDLMSNLTDSVSDKRALAKFPEFKDMLQLGKAMEQFRRLNDSTIESRLTDVVMADM